MIELTAGTIFAGYRVDALAGRGGMGVVYRATEIALERTVAVKVMAPWLAEDDVARRRFLREARLAASLEHPNVIPIHAAGEHEGLAYLVMRYVDGSDLRGLIRSEGALAPARATRIVAEVAAALDAAHAVGLVHRDVKPANVLLDADEHVYLADFGLTRGEWSTSGPQPTESGVFVGTSDYVAPEQIRGVSVDARADVYSLGAVLFHVLTGETPFAGRNHEAVLWAHLTEPPPAPSKRHAGIPRALDVVVARAMAKRPPDRYPSAGDLGRAAVAAAAGRRSTVPERAIGTGAAALTDSALTVSTRLPRRRRLVWAGVGAAALIAAAGFALQLRDDASRPPPARSAAPEATPTPSAPRVRLIGVGGRAISVAAAGDHVWALAGTKKTQLVRIAPASGRTRPVAEWSRGGQELVVAGDDLYAVFSGVSRVLRLDAATGRQRSASDVFAGLTRRMAVGLGAVWVTERSTDATQPDHLLRLDPVTLRTVWRAPMANGARDVTTGGGRLWVASRDLQQVVRVDPSNGAVMGDLGVGNVPSEIAYGRGAVWSASDDGTVSRTPLSTRTKMEISVPGEPAGIAIRGRSVFVSALATNRLYRIDARKNRVAGKPVSVCVNPALLDTTATTVWVACPGDRRVARVKGV
ncbi:MAG TPA: protein kinase [Solirubrobacteraceae bacterium]|nr:protein kinase [Solirubrobacteraceae bacterium]